MVPRPLGAGKKCLVLKNQIDFSFQSIEGGLDFRSADEDLLHGGLDRFGNLGVLFVVRQGLGVLEHLFPEGGLRNGLGPFGGGPAGPGNGIAGFGEVPGGHGGDELGKLPGRFLLGAAFGNHPGPAGGGDGGIPACPYNLSF